MLLTIVLRHKYRQVRVIEEDNVPDRTLDCNDNSNLTLNQFSNKYPTLSLNECNIDRS